MKHQLLLSVLLASSLAACGGGGGGSSSGSAAPTATAKYVFATPVAGSQSTYTTTAVSNLNDTITQTYVSEVTTVNADGTFVTQSHGLTNNSVQSGEIEYTIYPVLSDVDSVGRVIDTTTWLSTLDASGCTYSPNEGTAPSPLEIGQSWSATYSACTNIAAVPVTTFTRTGTLVGEESLTVPAGTFDAFKFQSTLTFTENNGATVTETLTTWRNSSSTDSRMLQEVINFSYSPSAPAQGVIVSRTTALQSYQ